ncbi:MAG: glutamine--tRNA ligase, partial [Bacilli bacterium]|nr:glutamine--tRNA ligase [Bacilli bacterium]
INSTVSSEMLENALRNDLVNKTKRVHAVLDPIKVIIINYLESSIEYVDVENNVDNPDLSSRKLPFGREIYIEKSDFLPEKPNKHWKRLSLGLEVRLMHAYFIKCENVVYNTDGSIKELHCTYDERTKSGSGFNERKPNGNVHFVEATTAIPAKFNLFEPLLVDSDSDRDLMERLNTNSWQTLSGYVEPDLKNAVSGERFQFVRNGYYSVDYETKGGELVFNRIVELKSSVR